MLRGAVSFFPVAASLSVSCYRRGPGTLRFDINEYRIDGSTPLKKEQVDSAVAPFREKSAISLTSSARSGL